MEKSTASLLSSRAYERVYEDLLMPDPLKDRQVEEVLRPPNKRLTLERLLEDSKVDGQMRTPDPELIKNFQYARGLLNKEAFLEIVRLATQAMSRE